MPQGSGRDSRYYKAGKTLLQRTLSSFCGDGLISGQIPWWEGKSLWAQGPGTGAVGPCRWGMLLTSLVQRALIWLLWRLSWEKDSPMMSTGKAPQNTENYWVWKDSVEVTSCNHRLRQGLLEPATQDLSKYIQGRKLHRFSGQLVPVLCHPPSIHRQLSVFQLLSLAPSLVTG